MRALPGAVCDGAGYRDRQAHARQVLDAIDRVVKNIAGEDRGDRYAHQKEDGGPAGNGEQTGGAGVPTRRPRQIDRCRIHVGRYSPFMIAMISPTVLSPAGSVIEASMAAAIASLKRAFSSSEISISSMPLSAAT
jgi:hypothetical protein